MGIRIEGSRLVDEHGRTLILRGVNLAGSSKLPTRPDGATHRPEALRNHRDVSFVGRPFPLEEADEHLARLRAWGLPFVRLLVTWEAVEHAGPGRYDEEYLDYLREVVVRAGRHGIRLFIDPHQDMWSRFTGGDGAPGWTLEAVGLDPTPERLQTSGAAALHALHEGPLPAMLWTTNETKLGAATMFTLFFGGDAFAPGIRVDGEPVQELLQRHYVAAVARVARALRDLPAVVGYDTLNEPLRGWLGWADLGRAGGLVRIGAHPTPFQAMALGAGFPQEVEHWRATPVGFRRTGTRTVNAEGARAWLPGHECVWRRSGVWDVGSGGAPRLLRPDHFARLDGRAVDFSRDFLRPFARRFAEAVRAAHPEALLFVESAPREPPPPRFGPGLVHAPHWYDGFVLFMRRYRRWVAVDAHTGRLVLTPWWIRRSFARQLEALRHETREHLGEAPTLIGELGIPFDLEGGRAYRTGDFRPQVEAMDRTLRALDDALLSGTLWSYTPDNTNARGDLWNGEDLSIFSRDQQTDPDDVHSGGRALEAVVRPCARAVAGEPLRMRYDRRRRTFTFAFRHDPRITAPTVLFVPDLAYPRGYEVVVPDGTAEPGPEPQTLLYRPATAGGMHTVRLRPRR